ncbi:MAG: type II secretion system protein GspM [Stenotrophobium sp.]
MIKQRLEQFQEWFRGLSPRERWMVSVCFTAVAFTILYLGIWQPLGNAYRQREAALISAHALGEQLEQIATDLQKTHGSGASAADRSLSLLAAVDQSSKSGALGKPLSRIQPDGDTSVKVWVDGVNFEGLLRWIAELETHYGVAVDTVDIEREGTAGVVNARLTLVRS